jgi:hypothetical protein
MIEVFVLIRDLDDKTSCARCGALSWNLPKNTITVADDTIALPEQLFVLQALKTCSTDFPGMSCQTFYQHGMTILEKFDKIDYLSVVKNPVKWHKIILLTMQHCSFYVHVELPTDVRKDWSDKLTHLSTRRKKK